VIERSCASWLSIVRRQLAAGNWKQHVAQLVPGVKSACLDTFRSGRERGEQVLARHCVSKPHDAQIQRGNSEQPDGPIPGLKRQLGEIRPESRGGRIDERARVYPGERHGTAVPVDGELNGSHGSSALLQQEAPGGERCGARCLSRAGRLTTPMISGPVKPAVTSLRSGGVSLSRWREAGGARLGQPEMAGGDQLWPGADLGAVADVALIWERCRCAD